MAFTKAKLTLGFDLVEIVDDEPASGPFRSDILENLPLEVKLSIGTSDGQANRAYFRKEMLTAGQTVTRDLAGSLTDRDGNAITLAKLDGLYLVNFNTNGTVQIGPLGAANAVSGLNAGTSAGSIAGAARNARDPGWCATRHPKGIAITGGSSDEIQITNNDGSNTANIYWGFIGRTA